MLNFLSTTRCFILCTFMFVGLSALFQLPIFVLGANIMTLVSVASILAGNQW